MDEYCRKSLQVNELRGYGRRRLSRDHVPKRGTRTEACAFNELMEKDFSLPWSDLSLVSSNGI
jgi:hypothetical protein